MKKKKEEFLRYTKDYMNLDKCILKVHHTFRVMMYCKEIAESLNLSDSDINLAMICGLLHDIGRFEQYRIYHTFVDSKSIDHGDLGVDILLKDNYISKYVTNESDVNVVLNSVKYHNKYMIDENLSDREKLFCNITRDADKIDILYLETSLNISFDNINDSFSDKVYSSLINHNLINKNDKKNKADVLSISLGFIYDINFKKSIELLKDKDYINTIIDIYKEKSNNYEFKKQLDIIRYVIQEYMNERIDSNEYRKSYNYNRR